MDSSRLAEHFGRQLWRHRRRAYLSQDRIAFVIGLHRTEISQLERGLRNPQLDTILKLAAGVEASPCELMAGLRWRPGSHALVGGGYAGSPTSATAPAASRKRVRNA
ncbi:MAG TPA: helix-turn-helix transcriptional regulator [Solirubrobacterales bacterium]|nr:helix-turn-helix transcriptional regulator [Solirubrobacterales bacterium]